MAQSLCSPFFYIYIYFKSSVKQGAAFPGTVWGNREQKSPGPVTAAARPRGAGKSLSQTCLKACEVQREGGAGGAFGELPGGSALNFRSPAVGEERLDASETNNPLVDARCSYIL